MKPYQTMTSKKIAGLSDRAHSLVLRIIDTLVQSISDADLHRGYESTTYVDSNEQEQQNRPLSYKEALYALIEAEERRERDMLVMLQQAKVINHKRIATDKSEDYIPVARVQSMNPNQRYSGALLGRISDKQNIPVIPQHAAKGQISINTYHKSVWELAYPEASLFD